MLIFFQTITFLKPREDEKTINVIAREVVAHNDKKKLQVQQVLNYVANEDVCRSTQLVSYFGETTATPCGICSVCTSKNKKYNKKALQEISKEVLAQVQTNPKTSREILERVGHPEKVVLQVITLLLGNDSMGLDTNNRYYRR